MRYRYLVDFRHGISEFVNFSYGIAVLGTPQCPPQWGRGSERPAAHTQQNLIQVTPLLAECHPLTCINNVGVNIPSLDIGQYENIRFKE